jgi:hypothetical protein
MIKSHQIKSNHRVLRKNEIYTNGAQVFRTTVWAAKMCTHSNEHCVIMNFYGMLDEKTLWEVALSKFKLFRILWFFTTISIIY